MIDPKDGGRVFSPTDYGMGAMTLRDWFAGQALAGLSNNVAYEGLHLDTVAQTAYALADAMLKARNQ